MSTTKTRELLKHALRALNETRSTRLHNDEYKDTYALAAAIDTHFAEVQPPAFTLGFSGEAVGLFQETLERFIGLKSELERV